jgi:hypothetical protein
MSRSAPSSGLARSITMSAIWENRRRLAGCSSFCRTPRSPRISGASRPPSIGGCGTGRCTSLHPSTSSSTRESSKSRARFRASRSPIVATRLACRCYKWIGGGRPPTDELFARSCGVRASFGDRLLFGRRVLSPGPSNQTRTISSSGRWTPAIRPERRAWASTRARRWSIRAWRATRSRMSSSPAPPRFPRQAAPTRRSRSWRSRSGRRKAQSPSGKSVGRGVRAGERRPAARARRSRRIELVRSGEIAQAALKAGDYPGMSDDAQGDVVPLRALAVIVRARRGWSDRHHLPYHAETEPEPGAKLGHRLVLCGRDRGQRSRLPVRADQL